MIRTTRKVLRRTFAAGVLGALAFGAVEAAAKPAAAVAATCTPQLSSACNETCKANGYSFGYCYVGLNTTRCACVP